MNSRPSEEGFVILESNNFRRSFLVFKRERIRQKSGCNTVGNRASLSIVNTHQLQHLDPGIDTSTSPKPGERKVDFVQRGRGGGVYNLHGVGPEFLRGCRWKGGRAAIRARLFLLAGHEIIINTRLG